MIPPEESETANADVKASPFGGRSILHAHARRALSRENGDTVADG